MAVASVSAGPCMCTAGVVSDAGWFPPVSCCSRRYSVSSNIIHLFLLLTGHCSQRTAPGFEPGFAGRDLPSDSHTSDKGINAVSLYAGMKVFEPNLAFRDAKILRESTKALLQ